MTNEITEQVLGYKTCSVALQISILRNLHRLQVSKAIPGPAYREALCNLRPSHNQDR